MNFAKFFDFWGKKFLSIVIFNGFLMNLVKFESSRMKKFNLKQFSVELTSSNIFKRLISNLGSIHFYGKIFFWRIGIDF